MSNIHRIVYVGEWPAIGTSLQGEIEIDYATLVAKLGEPELGDEYKTDAEWTIMFDDNEVATVYNYKDGHAYLQDEGLDTIDITDWHIGGFNPEVADRVKELLEAEND